MIKDFEIGKLFWNIIITGIFVRGRQEGQCQWGRGEDDIRGHRVREI